MRLGKSYQKHIHFIICLTLSLQNHVYPPCRERAPVLREHKIEWSLYTGFTIYSWSQHILSISGSMLSAIKRWEAVPCYQQSKDEKQFHVISNQKMIADSTKPPVAEMCWPDTPKLHSSTSILSTFQQVVGPPSHTFHQISNIRCTKSQDLNISHLVLYLSLPNPLKPCVKSRMKM